MKICPNCRASAAADQNFCLECGTPLTAADVQNFSNANDDSPTLVRPSSFPTAQIPSNTWQNQGATNPPQSGVPTYIVPVAPVVPKRSVLPVVLLTFFGTIALLTFGGVIIWFASRPKNVAVDISIGNKPTLNPNASPTPKPSPSPSVSPSVSPTPSATPSATLDAGEINDAKEEIGETLTDWKQASEDFDLDSHIACYAGTLENYYKQKNVSVGKVRADRQKAYQAYSDKIKIDLSNIKITPDSTGEKATVILDKTWDFEGTKFSSGSVQQQLTMQKIGGRWKIAGEQDLKVYYVDKGKYGDDQ